MKAIKSSFDVSAPGRQGFFALISHPVKGFRNIPEMFRAIKSEEAAFKIDTEIKGRENFTNGNYKKAGIALYERGEVAKNVNELFRSRWARLIPGIQASERGFTSFLNLMRADLFDAMHKYSFSERAATEAELKAIGDYAKQATGDGTAKGYETSLQGLGAFIWAPKLVLSRFQMLSGQGLWPGGNRTATTRKAVAREYARILGGLALIYSVNAIINDEPVEDSPLSSDFGKIKVGNTRIDLLAGISQVAVFMARLYEGKTKSIKTGLTTPITGDYVPYGGMTTWNVIANFLRTKLTPVLGSAISIRQGKDLVGNKVTLYDIPEQTVVPLAMMDIYQAMNEEGVPAGLALGTLGMFGVGIQTHEQKGARQ
jgi:hypothetical protein